MAESESAGVSRRGILGASLAGGTALALASCSATPKAEATSTPLPVGTLLPADKLAWTTYGEYLEQRPSKRSEKGANTTLGRYDPMGARPSASLLGAIELWCRFDRAAADQILNMCSYNHLSVPPVESIMDESWRCAAWCSTYNTPASGTFEIDLTLPKRTGIGYAAMLWPEKDSTWPNGEIDFLEGVTGKTVTSNLHYAQADGSDSGGLLQETHQLTVTGRHRYRIEIASRAIKLYQDGQLYREIDSEHVPFGDRCHLVVQLGADTSTLGINGSEHVEWSKIVGSQRDETSSAFQNFRFSEVTVVTPITIPTAK